MCVCERAQTIFYTRRSNGLFQTHAAIPKAPCASLYGKEKNSLAQSWHIGRPCVNHLLLLSAESYDADGVFQQRRVVCFVRLVLPLCAFHSTPAEAAAPVSNYFYFSLYIFLIRFNWLVFLFFPKRIRAESDRLHFALPLAFWLCAHGDDDKWR